MQVKLKEVINGAASRDMLYSFDWAALPLPQQMLQQEQAAAFSARQAQSSWPTDDDPPPAPFPAPTNVHMSKMRKSSEMTQDDPSSQASALPPWRKQAARNVFEDRITYANQSQADRIEKRQRKTHGSAKPSSKSGSNLEKRKQRFESTNSPHSPSPYYSPREGSPTPDANQGPIVGTCQQLEKKYFRLTSAPKPESVRPQPVLEKTLELLKSKWRKENNYSYICDQFKSLRQDLTVQHIKNEFTVHVYEIHARIALEKGDLGEYNQCQTQLRALYSQNLGGHPSEFLAYRILYLIHTCNRTDMNDLLADLTSADKEDPAVKHALAVRSALALGNYHRFFRLFLDTPHMGAYLMDMFIVRERVAALANICKAYKPDVLIRFLTEELGFESDMEFIQFLNDHGAEALLDAKEDGYRLMAGKAGQIFETVRAAAFRKVDIKGQI